MNAEIPAETSELNVLIVDDDDVDVLAIRRSFERRRLDVTLHFAGDGLQALQLLRGEVSSNLAVDAPLIVLLDINMPRMSGLEFLRELRADSRLQNTIVFVLTTSADPADISAAYALNVAGYMVKANVGDSFLDAVSLIDAYRRIVSLPS